MDLRQALPLCGLFLKEVEPNDLGRAQIERLVMLLNRAADYFEERHYDFVIPDAHEEGKR